MIAVKAIVSFLLVATTMVQGLLDYKFHDKRTRVFKRLRATNFAVLAIAAIGIVPITVCDSLEISALHTELAKLGTNVAPRSISDASRKLLVERLAALAPHQILVTASSGSDEALRFAGEFRDVLVEAGWDVLGPGQKTYGGLTTGLVLFKSPEVPNELVQAISSALADADLNLLVTSKRGAAIAIDAPDSPLEIFVGIK